MASTNPPYPSDLEDDPYYESEIADEQEETYWDDTDAATADWDHSSSSDAVEIYVIDDDTPGGGGAGRAELSDEEVEEKEKRAEKEAKEGPRPAPDWSGDLAEPDRSMTLNCPVCYEPLTAEGDHRVCCIPCGHVYGRSCLEMWIKKCGNKAGKCPTCNRRFKRHRIVNLYAPLIAIRNGDLEKEVLRLREKVEQLQLEKEIAARLQGRNMITQCLSEINRAEKEMFDKIMADVEELKECKLRYKAVFGATSTLDF